MSHAANQHHGNARLSRKRDRSAKTTAFSEGFQSNSLALLLHACSANAKRKEINMDQNKFKGSWHEIKGEAKKKWGKLTDDDLLQCEGDYEKFLGAVQKHYGDEEKQSAQRWAE